MTQFEFQTWYLSTTTRIIEQNFDIKFASRFYRRFAL